MSDEPGITIGYRRRRDGGHFFGIYITSRLVLGLILLAFGVLFLLDSLQILEARHYIAYWPVALIAIGLAKLIPRGAAPSRAGGVIWILVGSLMLLHNLGVFHLRARDIVAVALLALGGVIVWGAVWKQTRTGAVTDTSETINLLAVMAGLERKVSSQEFRGGEATAVMGGCEIDLRGASIADGPAVIDVFAMWGGIDLIVPEDWTVVGQVVPLMGGFEDKTNPPSPGTKIPAFADNTQPPSAGPRKELVLKGFAIMGGVEVRNK